jgi:methylase of polypeptide subunit release factors
MQTIQDLYRYAITLYNRNELSYGHTTDNAFEDAAFLILHELHLPYTDPICQWSTSRLTRFERKHILNLIHQRATTKTPAAYLVGGCYQQGEYFRIDSRALIPRSYLGEIMLSKTINIVGSNNGGATISQDIAVAKPQSPSGPTESSGLPSASSVEYRDMDYEDYFEAEVETAPELSVENQLDLLYGRRKSQFLIDTDRVRSVLDLCTGSGCLAVLAAKAFPLVEEIDAVDVSSDALEVAVSNVDLHGLDELVTLHHGDLFSPLNNATYDLIITNPPYVSEERMEDLPDEYTHEPVLALTAGQDGLNVISRILLGAYDHLNEGGGLLCEIGQCKDELEQAFPKLFGSAFYSIEDTTRNSISDEVVTFVHDSSATSKRKVHWINTANSKDEVFYVEKRYLAKEYLTRQ